jgi:hypothetical protein
VVCALLALQLYKRKRFSTINKHMRKKSSEKLQQDLMVDDLYPFLPANYASLVQHFIPEMEAMRLYDVVRKRGLEADPEALRALLMVKRPQPVGRVPRKKYAPRTASPLAA